MYINKIVCLKCHGLGNIPYYAGIRDGICFQCGGSGLITEKSNIKKDTPNPKECYNQYIQDKKQQVIKHNKIKELKDKIQELESDLKANTDIETTKQGLINIFKKMNKNYTQQELDAFIDAINVTIKLNNDKICKIKKELKELYKQLYELTNDK